MDINTEIIKYEQIEEELYKNGELFRSFSENSLDIHGIFKPVYNDKKEIADFICMYQNIAAHTIGKSSKDIIGVPLSKAYPKIFEPFKQELDHVKSHNNRGLGLGLSLVKEIMEMHGGDVSVNSFGLGKGALFTMRIPIVKNL